MTAAGRPEWIKKIAELQNYDPEDDDMRLSDREVEFLADLVKYNVDLNRELSPKQIAWLDSIWEDTFS